MPAIAIRQDIPVGELRRQARLGEDGRVAARLLAIAAVLDGHSRAHAARLGGMVRQTLRDWGHRFNAEGVAGLRDRPRSGRPRLLADELRPELAALIADGPDLERDGVVEDHLLVSQAGGHSMAKAKRSRKQRELAPVHPTPRRSTSAPRCMWRRSPPRAPRNRCAASAPSPATCTVWRIGSSAAA